jgi:hypothetical protein
MKRFERHVPRATGTLAACATSKIRSRMSSFVSWLKPRTRGQTGPFQRGSPFLSSGAAICSTNFETLFANFARCAVTVTSCTVSVAVEPFDGADGSPARASENARTASAAARINALKVPDIGSNFISARVAAPSCSRPDGAAASIAVLLNRGILGTHDPSRSCQRARLVARRRAA